MRLTNAILCWTLATSLVMLLPEPDRDELFWPAGLSCTTSPEISGAGWSRRWPWS